MYFHSVVEAQHQLLYGILGYKQRNWKHLRKPNMKTCVSYSSKDYYQSHWGKPGNKKGSTENVAQKSCINVLLLVSKQFPFDDLYIHFVKYGERTSARASFAPRLPGLSGEVYWPQGPSSPVRVTFSNSYKLKKLVYSNQHRLRSSGVTCCCWV